MRSWLLAPCSSAADFAVARTSGADVVVLDLVAMPQALQWPATEPLRAPRLAVQIGEAIEDDLDAVTPFGPWAILANCNSGADVQRLGGKLAVREARFGLAHGATRVVARIDHSKAALNLTSFAGASPRLAALLFDGRGPSTSLARSLVALAAAAAGVAAIDGAGNQSFFREQATSARDAGYSGKFATTSEEVAILNALFPAI